VHQMFRRIKPVLSVCILFIFAAGASAQQPTERNSVRNVLNESGTEPTEDASKKFSLMMVLHGGLGNAEIMENATGMDAVVDVSISCALSIDCREGADDIAIFEIHGDQDANVSLVIRRPMRPGNS
jgi:hypothetical protein